MDRPSRLLLTLTLCLPSLAGAMEREPQACPQPLLDSLATQLVQQNWIPPTYDNDGPTRCDIFVMSNDRLTLLTDDGQRFPLRAIR